MKLFSWFFWCLSRLNYLEKWRHERELLLELLRRKFQEEKWTQKFWAANLLQSKAQWTILSSRPNPVSQIFQWQMLNYWIREFRIRLAFWENGTDVQKTSRQIISFRWNLMHRGHVLHFPKRALEIMTEWKMQTSKHMNLYQKLSGRNFVIGKII